MPTASYINHGFEGRATLWRSPSSPTPDHGVPQDTHCDSNCLAILRSCCLSCLCQGPAKDQAGELVLVAVRPVGVEEFRTEPRTPPIPSWATDHPQQQEGGVGHSDGNEGRNDNANEQSKSIAASKKLIRNVY